MSITVSGTFYDARITGEQSFKLTGKWYSRRMGDYGEMSDTVTTSTIVAMTLNEGVPYFVSETGLIYEVGSWQQKPESERKHDVTVATHRLANALTAMLAWPERDERTTREATEALRVYNDVLLGRVTLRSGSPELDELVNGPKPGKKDKPSPVLMSTTELCENLIKRMREIDGKITSRSGDDSRDRPPTGDDYNLLWDAVLDEMREALPRFDFSERLSAPDPEPNPELTIDDIAEALRGVLHDDQNVVADSPAQRRAYEVMESYDAIMKG